MEFIPTSIKRFQFTSYGPLLLGEISLKSDCTEIKGLTGSITNIQTYFPQDSRKDRNLIFPTKFIKFFKLLSSSEFGRRFWFEDCRVSNFVEADIDTSYDTDVGEIHTNGGSESTFMRYIYRDMVLPFKKLEKENNQLRGQLQLQRKDREIERKDQELAQMKKQLESKDQEMEKMKEQFKEMVLTFMWLKEKKDQEETHMKEQLAQMKEQLESKDQEIKISLLTASTLTSAIVAKDEELEEKDQYFEFMLQELKDTQEELKETQEEVKTRGLLLKSCVDDLKTYVEEVEEVEKKNQELEHLNHRLIYETSSFVERNSYFSPEM